MALLGAKRPQAKKAWTNRYVKLLVIGDSGLGKTTLVKCLLATPGEGLALHDGSSTTFEEFRKNPAKYCSVVEWDDDEDHVHWTYQARRCFFGTPLFLRCRHLPLCAARAFVGDKAGCKQGVRTPGVSGVAHEARRRCDSGWDKSKTAPRAHMQIQDTPGYGDELDLHNNIRRIKELIADQNDLWHQRETDTNRGQLDKVIDPRIDICIFCLPPHRVRNIDIHFMHQVSQVRPPSPRPVLHRCPAHSTASSPPAC